MPCPTSAAGSDDTPRRTLRVGFYAYTGYHVMDEDGHRSGYSYEVLQRIAQHENVQFEYLAYDCDANEAADMLERGEIDLLPTLRKTDERAERFDFSSEPISNVATMLTVKGSGNRSIVAGNYDTFDGMVVGMSRSGNGRNESFKAYAGETALPTRRSILTPMRNFPPHCAAAPLRRQSPTGCARPPTNGSSTPLTMRTSTLPCAKAMLRPCGLSTTR